MPEFKLEDLLELAEAAEDPMFPPKTIGKAGGVDPLGLRQINFDLMDKVIPGLNNAARHIRPFVVIAWAYRRALAIADERGLTVTEEEVSDFVDRIQFVYAWSQFRLNPESDLPGRREFAGVASIEERTFGGPGWRALRNRRAASTALTAAVNYGPALKELGWVTVHPKHRKLLIPCPEVDSALDAFEHAIRNCLEHSVFNKFGSVKVTVKELDVWGKSWALAKPTKAERQVMKSMLIGENINPIRKAGVELMLSAYEKIGGGTLSELRKEMALGAGSISNDHNLAETSDAWRAVQVRQLFRLCLEALLHWMIQRIDRGTKTSDELATRFFHVAKRKSRVTRQWLSDKSGAFEGPVELIEALNSSFGLGWDTVAEAIADGLAFCLIDVEDLGRIDERAERLPLRRAKREAANFDEKSTRDFIKHVMESWILAQHTYWSVARGMADARINAVRKITRLRIALEEEGLTLTPGASETNPPVATPDRLNTVLNLANEAGLL